MTRGRMGAGNVALILNLIGQKVHVLSLTSFIILPVAQANFLRLILKELTECFYLRGTKQAWAVPDLPRCGWKVSVPTMRGCDVQRCLRQPAQSWTRRGHRMRRGPEQDQVHSAQPGVTTMTNFC